MTKRIYYGSTETTATVKIVEVGTDDRGHWVVTDQTIAHVKGGGAKADRGTIGAASFHDVVATNGRNSPVKHYLNESPNFEAGDSVNMMIDPEWRATQAAYHSGGHLIAAVVEQLEPSVQAVQGHHYPGEARVEFVGTLENDLAELQPSIERNLARAIKSDLLIEVVGDPQTDRKVQIGEFAPVPCGGIHCPSTSHLGEVTLRKIKTKGGKLRISYEVHPKSE
ncbi:hypothetical protein [Roseiconus lacunae]|uniref:Threonyl/alanyl tRNA synthetase SAD domain-containing protein n=1 Tax=Roseiconus lacunae TaxID=2605694 RepID=A0ABT7PNW0_9BACT|nr:hypothetical protein [Roseiconus lacunae]MDM4018193.1 hypothetical protein [Roseiconus lacunae]